MGFCSSTRYRQCADVMKTHYFHIKRRCCSKLRTQKTKKKDLEMWTFRWKKCVGRLFVTSSFSLKLPELWVRNERRNLFMLILKLESWIKITFHWKCRCDRCNFEYFLHLVSLFQSVPMHECVELILISKFRIVFFSLLVIDKSVSCNETNCHLFAQLVLIICIN